MAKTALPTKDLARYHLAALPGQTFSDQDCSAFAHPLRLWHLLSLDAPTVAVLWTWFLARANHVDLPAASLLAMAVAVWTLYAADRLLDTRDRGLPQQMEERHFFHRANRRFFAMGIGFACLVLAVLLPSLPGSSLRLYLILGSLLFAYFILIHTASASAHAQRLPKELAVGVFFSAASFVPTVSRQPQLRVVLLPAALLFAALCSLNCLFIYAWEHPRPTPSAHAATRIALRFLPALTVVAATSGLAMSIARTLLPWRIPAACACAAGLLLLLHRCQARFSRITLRAAADLCLLTPLLFVPLLNR